MGVNPRKTFQILRNQPLISRSDPDLDPDLDPDPGPDPDPGHNPNLACDTGASLIVQSVSFRRSWSWLGLGSGSGLWSGSWSGLGSG